MDFVPLTGPSQFAPVPNVVPVEHMVGDDEEDTALLREMLEQAKSYALSFSWCDSIENAYFGGGVGKIFAIFLFKITTKSPKVPAWEWIIVGDAPRAYLPLKDANSGLEVFDIYIEGMERWVNCARQGRDPILEDCVPPINVPATPEWAENLSGRLRLLKELIRPYFE